jgi:hypothetical protein
VISVAGCDHRERRRAIERRHPAHRRRDLRLVDRALLERVRKDAGADRFREHEDVARARARVRDRALWMHRARNGHAVLRLVVFHGMATQDRDAGFARDRGAAG